jgi:D-serine deaminase-like pyridoxal phosphate-dependent protein
LKESNMEWYTINNIDQFDSPALVLYPERIAENIRLIKSMVDDVARLRPHVKTNKCMETAKLLVNAGILKFKCATIPEAEMLAMCGAQDIVLAYQPTLPRLHRLIALIKDHPAVRFACLVDNKASARQIAAECADAGIMLDVYIDLDLGMHRTGIEPGNEALELYAYCASLQGIRMAGLHAYDGHQRNPDIGERTISCDAAFEEVTLLRNKIRAHNLPEPLIIAGGSPTFPIHARRKDVECSPGTFIYWDRGYSVVCAEQPFLPAAVLVTRVISLPGKTRLCLDLGHKGVAAENEMEKRVYFLNASNLKPVSQSEEHLVVEAGEHHGYQPGDVLYALPYHVCPTVALYERSYVAENNNITGEWKHVARDRKITY